MIHICALLSKIQRSFKQPHNKIIIGRQEHILKRNVLSFLIGYS